MATGYKIVLVSATRADSSEILGRMRGKVI